MDKSKTLERLNALESEAKELRKIIEAPEQPPSLLTKPEPGIQDITYRVSATGYGRLRSYTGAIVASNDGPYNHGNNFQSEELADAYAEAFDTLLLLRHQPGTVAPTGAIQWLISVNFYLTTCSTLMEDNKFKKLTRITPCFASEEHAKQAIETVGEERILRMFKTLHHIS